MQNLLSEIKQCTVCEPHLELGANPVVSGSPYSKIAIIGQAPGTKVHKSGVPWDDASGKQLRNWLNVTDEDFYDVEKFAIYLWDFVILVKELLVTNHQEKNALHYGISNYLTKCPISNWSFLSECMRKTIISKTGQKER
jgi:uracil-DNA glycosylase